MDPQRLTVTGIGTEKRESGNSPGWPGALDLARGDARRVSLRVLRVQNDYRRFGLRGRAPREVSGDHPGPHWAKVNIVGS